MSKHTPGPWQTIEVGEFTTKLVVADSQGVSVLTVVDEEGTKFGAVYSEADADLIAAAPEMLEALRKAVVLLAGVCVHSPEWEPHKTYYAVSAAIAKATGCDAGARM